jgi:hypothetical protein
LHSVPDLIAAIETYLHTSDENPERFTWIATPGRSLRSTRGRLTLDTTTN